MWLIAANDGFFAAAAVVAIASVAVASVVVATTTVFFNRKPSAPNRTSIPKVLRRPKLLIEELLVPWVDGEPGLLLAQCGEAEAGLAILLLLLVFFPLPVPDLLGCPGQEELHVLRVEVGHPVGGGRRGIAGGRGAAEALPKVVLLAA